MRAGSGSSTSTPTMAGSRWRSRPAGRTSASPTSSATTGSWPRSSGSTSPSTSRWTASATRRCRSRACATWTCSTRTRPTSTPRTSPPEEWALARDSGGNVSFAPQIEVQMGHGWAPAVTALEYGLPIGLSSDVATTAPIRPVHPDALDLRFGARAEAPGSLGRQPRRARGLAGTHHGSTGPVVGDHRWGARSPGSPIGRAR